MRRLLILAALLVVSTATAQRDPREVAREEHGEWGPDARARHERELEEARESGDPERVREVEEREPHCFVGPDAVEVCR